MQWWKPPLGYGLNSVLCGGHTDLGLQDTKQSRLQLCVLRQRQTQLQLKRRGVPSAATNFQELKLLTLMQRSVILYVINFNPNIEAGCYHPSIKTATTDWKIIRRLNSNAAANSLHANIALDCYISRTKTINRVNTGQIITFHYSFYLTYFLFLRTDGASWNKGALSNVRPGITQASVTKIKTIIW